MIQCHMIVSPAPPSGFAADGRAVHQLPGANELTFNEDRMVWRNEEFPMRHCRTDRMWADADWCHGLWVRMFAEIDVTMPNPPNWAGRGFLPRQGLNEVAGHQAFDQGLACRSHEMRASDVARNMEPRVS